MPNQQMLEKYAEVIFVSGVNLQKDQPVYIMCPLPASDFALVLSRVAYKLGASTVYIEYINEKLMRLRYENETTEALADVPPFKAEERDWFAAKNAAFISIAALDPNAYAGISVDKQQAYTNALRKKRKKFMDATMSNGVRWNVMSVPTPVWAKEVFPDLSEEDAVQKLWDYIFKTMYMDSPDPILAWKEHCIKASKRAEFLNSHDIVSYHYKNSIGTDLEVGMMDDSIFLCAEEVAKDGVPFIANLPTQEIFSAPHRDKINGTLHSAMPLVYSGNIIDDFSLTFKDGKVVSYSAKRGEDVLKSILDTDEGSKYLGEIAFVEYDSPISNLKTLFYETLFDENASCHFALGQGYPTCTKSCPAMSKEEQVKHGLNDSLNHIDFMVGTSDLDIVATTRSGEKIQIFKNGNFVI